MASGSVVFVLAIMIGKAVTQKCFPVTDLCPNIKTTEEMVFGGEVGHWYMYASTPVTQNGNYCNFFETVYPCGCINGHMLSGSAHSFAQNLETGVGVKELFIVDFVETCNNLHIFNFTYAKDGGFSHTVASLGSDSGKSYWLFSVCKTGKQYKSRNSDPVIWFFTRTPVATNESIEAVKVIMEKNNLNYNILEQVNQTFCSNTSLA